MSKSPLIECVPNFSEGRDQLVIDQITEEIKKSEGVKLLDVDPGSATNRTVVTFVGDPDSVVTAAFKAIKKASELIDMSKHKGEHPRMGATDVCPLIPIRDISMEETAEWAARLGKRVGEELGIPVYLYEGAATRPERKNLATVRSGEYEGLADKLKDPKWAPDFGPAVFNERSGATAIAARDFLIAYNVNLNTTSVRRANSVAFDVREKGRVKREGDPISGKIARDADGNPVREPGLCKGVKAIGWYIDEYGIAQISMNITDTRQTPLHIAFEACRKSATSRGLRVTGSELVGLVPRQVMIDAGKYYLSQQNRSHGIPDEEIIHIAVKSMGLDEMYPFDPYQKIIEYQLERPGSGELVSKNLREFANETASESVAPGGGSIAAYVGALGASLATMVANLSGHKRGWDDRWEYFSDWAVKGQSLKEELLELVDKDTDAFNAIISAIRLPKGSEEEKAVRAKAIENATKQAIEVPFRTMVLADQVFEVAEKMVEEGNPTSITDAGVGALCARAASIAAYLNVVVNCQDLNDVEYVNEITSQADALKASAIERETKITKLVTQKLNA
ncbi:MAG: glutamate formimidoyltransferase [Saprospirales bacterium]|nr:MAG: glutamate formimidoyltransferase [Saprospirales bacterium]